MTHKIQTITFPYQIPRGKTGLQQFQPFGDSPPGAVLSFKDGVIGQITVTDNNETFDRIKSAEVVNGQLLSKPTTFGPGNEGEVRGIGEQISNLPGVIVESTATGDKFYLIYPYQQTNRNLDEAILGNQTVLLIFPQPTKNEDGSLSFPGFDKSAPFTLKKFGDTSIAYLSQPYSAVDCFAQGTLIHTSTGMRAVETLQPGDLVATRDHGLRPIRWIGNTTLSAHRLDLQPNLRPIKISAGALGPNIPAQELMVSPQHRVLLRSSKARRLFGEEEVLVAAKHLTDLPGISAISPKRGVTYWHFLLDEHEIVLSNGAWTETLFTGPQALRNLSSSERREIFSLFPYLKDAEFRPVSARRLLNGKEGRNIARRQLKNSTRPLFML